MFCYGMKLWDAHPIAHIKARGGIEGLKMPYFDFSMCYRAGKDEPNAKNERLI